MTVTVGGTIGDKAVVDRRKCTLCGITNIVNILKGVELLMNIPEPVLCDDKTEPPSKRQRLDTTAQAA